ncbi:MAG: hypothetical protein EPO40_06125 [Myxococcaceae bacterium]|nr:MAG: hypothetical protein EPO40_06125 [Myxococcaceae bacterium]
MSRILSIETKNFRGAADTVLHLAPSGVIAAGRNGAGKTSVIRAVRAALGVAGDATADAVRTGAPEAQVVLRTEGYTVTRRILPEGRQPAVKVETTGAIQAAVKRPAEFLAAQAAHSLDPLAFYLADPKLRREMLLAAMPVVVTEAQLRAWDPSLPPSYDCSGHGLEVLARRHAEVYAARAVANRQAEESARKAKEAQAQSDAAPALDAPSIEEAEATLGACRSVVADLRHRATAAEQAATRSAGTRARVEQLRAQAEGLEARDVRELLSEETLQGREAEAAELDEEVDRLERHLAALRTRRDELVAGTRAAYARRAEAASLRGQAEALRAQADDLEAVLAGAAPVPPTDDDHRVASAAESAALDLLRLARQAAAAQQLAAAAEAARVAALADQAAAQALTATVKALSKDAPAALVASTPGLEGLALSGDTITLHGVSLDGLCGAEQLRFAVDLAKRLGADAPLRVLTVDGLERVDPEHLDAFVAHCTDGGWQLIATLVERGELTFRQLEAGADDGLFD